MRITYEAREAARKALAWSRDNPRRVRAIATLLAIVLVVGAFLGPFVLASEEARHLSAYSDGSRDLSRFRAEVEEAARRAGANEPRALATSPFLIASLDEPARSVLFVVGVERAYTRGEREVLLDFVARGGTLVLANDVSNANRLSDEFGVAFGDKIVLDEASNYKGDPRIVMVVLEYGGRELKLALNAPAYATLTDANQAKVLATSSSQAFIDVNEDGTISVPPDIAGQFPLVMSAEHGEGRVLVIADTGVFMNEMLALPGFDNAAFARAIVADAATSGGHVLIDESRHVPPPSSRTGDAALRLYVLATTTPTLRAVVGVTSLLLVIGAVLLTKGTEDWSVHVFDVGHERHAPSDVGPTPARLRALAARAVSERYNIPLEYLESASLDEIAQLTGDRELAQVAKGSERVGDPRAFYRKLIDIVPTQIEVKEVPK